MWSRLGGFPGTGTPGGGCGDRFGAWRWKLAGAGHVCVPDELPRESLTTRQIERHFGVHGSLQARFWAKAAMHMWQRRSTAEPEVVDRPAQRCRDRRDRPGTDDPQQPPA